MLPKTNTSNHSNHNVIDGYALDRIEYRAKRLAIQLGLSDQDREDYFQEMIAEVLSAFKKFDECKSSRKTFINRVLDRFVKNAIRTEMTRRRRTFDNALPLSVVEEIAIPAVNDPHVDEMNEIERLDLRMDIQKIMSCMPQRLTQICELITDHSVSEIANKLGIHRTSIYRYIAEIRKYFNRGGYEFLTFRATNVA